MKITTNHQKGKRKECDSASRLDDMKKKVLMFAYDYPPHGWSGVQRTVKFVKYMPEYNWEPIVLTPLDRYSSVPLDYSFCDEVAHAVTIRTGSFTNNHWSRLGHLLWKVLKPFLAGKGRNEKWLAQGLKWRLESLLFPDRCMTWFPYAVFQGLRAVSTYKPKVIYATAPPYSTLLSGWIVAKISGLPLVLDLRDLWIDNPSRKVNGQIKQKIDIFLEKFCLDSSAAIITTTRTGADLLKKKYPKKSERIYTIYNGYDKKDFDNHIGGSQSKERLEKLTISHIGSLYAERTPAAFLKGLATFIQRNNTVHDVLSVRFVGQVSSFLKTFEEYEHLGVLKIEEPVEHPLAIEIMISSDLLILIMPDGSQRVVYAKVFEYLASGRPILGILPMDGEVAELLRQAGNAWLVDVKDEEGIVQSLNEIYERWRSGRILGKTDQETVRKFERRNLTSQLCEILANVAG